MPEIIEMNESTLGCPVVDWFNPNDTGAHPDPFPWYRQLREAGRIVFLPAPGGVGGMYVVNRHKEATEILRDPVTYSNAESLGTAQPAPLAIREEAGGDDWTYPFTDTLTLNDPPKHTRLRKLLAPSFTPRRIARFESMVREIADSHVDAFVAHGAAELASEFAYKIPNLVIGRIIGAEDAMAERFVEWTEAFLRVQLTELSGDEELRCWRLLLEQDRYARALIEDRRQNPQDDLTTDMIRATSDDGEPALTAEEIVAATQSFIGAGSETSAIMMLHTMYLLLMNPEQWDEVRSDPSLVPAAVEEGLRLRGAVRGLVRVVTADTEVAGVHFPKGARVYLNMMSANHDEEVFEHPERFDIHRANRHEHLAFGKWAHFCIGAPLARLEGRVAIEVLIDRLPNLRLAPEHGFGYDDNLVLPPVKALRVEWG